MPSIFIGVTPKYPRPTMLNCYKINIVDNIVTAECWGAESVLAQLQEMADCKFSYYKFKYDVSVSGSRGLCSGLGRSVSLAFYASVRWVKITHKTDDGAHFDMRLHISLESSECRCDGCKEIEAR